MTNSFDIMNFSIIGSASKKRQMNANAAIWKNIMFATGVEGYAIPS